MEQHLYQRTNETQHYKLMRNKHASICMWDLDAEKERQRLVNGIWDEMLQKNSSHTLATENKECKDQTKTWHQKECDVTDNGEETQIMWAYLQDGWQTVSGIIDGLNRRGRPRREWMDDMKEWCWTDAQTLSIIAQDHSEWRRIVMEALDKRVQAPPWNEEEKFSVISHTLKSIH